MAPYMDPIGYGFPLYHQVPMIKHVAGPVHFSKSDWTGVIFRRCILRG